MEKYGILREYRCKCGYCVIMTDNKLGPDMVKTAGDRNKNHVHKLVQILEDIQNDKQTEGGELRLERSESEETIRTNY